VYKKKNNKKKAAAVISGNGNVVQEGDVVKGDIVIKIHKDKVEIENSQKVNKQVQKYRGPNPQ